MSEVDPPIDPAADAALLAELAAAATQNDPVPAHLVEFARVAADLRRIDDELATLLDSAALAGVRSTATDDVMSFAGTDTTIEIDVTDRRLTGQLLPPSAAAITLVGPDGIIDEAVADARGHFSFELPRGSVRVTAVAGDTTVSTDWFLV